MGTRARAQMEHFLMTCQMTFCNLNSVTTEVKPTKERRRRIDELREKAQPRERSNSLRLIHAERWRGIH